MSFFFKTKCYEPLFAEFSSVLHKKAKFLADFFGENIFKIVTSVPGHFVNAR
jgi:hypothetical protein